MVLFIPIPPRLRATFLGSPPAQPESGTSLPPCGAEGRAAGDLQRPWLCWLPQKPSRIRTAVGFSCCGHLRGRPPARAGWMWALVLLWGQSGCLAGEELLAEQDPWGAQRR